MCVWHGWATLCESRDAHSLGQECSCTTAPSAHSLMRGHPEKRRHSEKRRSQKLWWETREDEVSHNSQLTAKYNMFVILMHIKKERAFFTTTSNITLKLCLYGLIWSTSDLPFSSWGLENLTNLLCLHDISITSKFWNSPCLMFIYYNIRLLKMIHLSHICIHIRTQYYASLIKHDRNKWTFFSPPFATNHNLSVKK